MTDYIINLTELVDPPFTDSIFGRAFGIKHANDVDLMKHLDSNEKIIIVIDGDLVKAINDSFIKGFYSSVFEKYKTLAFVKEHFELHASDDFKKLFEKNWLILDAINNA